MILRGRSTKGIRIGAPSKAKQIACADKMKKKAREAVYSGMQMKLIAFIRRAA